MKTIIVKDLDQAGNVIGEHEKQVTNDDYSELLINQDKLFKQCRQASSDLGLTISSRCRLVIPKKMMGNRSQKRKNGSGPHVMQEINAEILIERVWSYAEKIRSGEIKASKKAQMGC